MYRYRNKKTGAVIKTPCEIVGKNWEPVEDKPNQQSYLEAPPVDDPMVEGDPRGETHEEETSEEESMVEEAPPEKPKTARRGKK